MLSGWAYLRGKVPVCKKTVAKEVGRLNLKWTYFHETTVYLSVIKVKCMLI